MGERGMRQYGAGGARGPWQEQVASPAVPFQRTDGSVMSQEEIAKVATTDTPWNKTQDVAAQSKPGRRPIQPEEAERAWNAVKEHGTQTAAAKALGMTQQQLQTRLSRYMTAHGIAGPMPGLQNKEQLSATHRKQADSSARSRASTTEGRANRSAQAPVGRNGHSFGAVYEPLEAAALDDMVGGTTSPKSDPTRLVPRPALLAPIHDVTADPAVGALMEWLALHGPTWTQLEAERWFKALTNVIDLVYPTAEAAA